MKRKRFKNLQLMILNPFHAVLIAGVKENNPCFKFLKNKIKNFQIFT